MKEKISEFDASAYLDSDEGIAEYLTAVLEENNPDLFVLALGDVAKARGMTQQALMPGTKPRYDTIFKVLHGLGLKLAITT